MCAHRCTTPTHHDQIIPEHATYRQVVEEFTNQRLAAVKQHEDVEMIEDAIGCGQAEELIEAAKNELILIPQYASWKMWEKKRPTPNDDEYEGLFNDMENADPESLQGPLKAYAKSQREHADARRAAAAAAAKPAAPAPVPGALPAGKP